MKCFVTIECRSEKTDDAFADLRDCIGLPTEFLHSNYPNDARFYLFGNLVAVEREHVATTREATLLGALAEIARADTLEEARAIAEAHLEEAR